MGFGWTDRIVLQFKRCHGSSTVEVQAKFQSHMIHIQFRAFEAFYIPDKTSYRLVNRGPDI